MVAGNASPRDGVGPEYHAGGGAVSLYTLYKTA